jgi:hypothetical protein
MTIKNVVLPYSDDEDNYENTYGKIINMVCNDFPITITGTMDKDEIKKSFLEICSSLFDNAWNECENGVDSRYVYQYGTVS